MLSDTIHERMKGWFARILLGLIIISFALFGVDAYFKGSGGGQWVAEVGKQKIGALEFDDAVRQEQARLRNQGETDPAKLEAADLKQRVLDQMIRERVLLQAAVGRGYEMSDEAVLPAVVANPAFQENGQFSEQRFDQFLRQQRTSRAQFLQSLKQEALVNNMMGVPLASMIIPKSASQHLAQLLGEQREVSRAVIGLQPFLAKVRVDDASVQAYYTAHPEVSHVEEQARVEYVVFSPDVLLPGIAVSEADAKAYYDQHASDFATPEQREASHILIRISPDAKEADRKAAEQKAAEVLQRAKADPAGFAALARQFSQDPSTAGKGGDLGAITPGSIFPAVEKAIFEMKPGEVGGPVQSPAGLHILLLKSVKPATQRPFAEVKDIALEDARREAAMRRFNEEADRFGDLVYAQYASLKPAADQYKLTIQTSDWIGRHGAASGVLKNERLLQALFSDEAIKQKRNTEAIEVSPNTLVAARIAEYKPAGQRPLAEVRAQIEAILAREQAEKMAVAEGERALAELRQGHAVSGVNFGPSQALTRQDAEGFAPAEVRAVFQANARQLPAYAGLALQQGGYAIYRISGASASPERVKEAEQLAPALLQRTTAMLIGASYVDSLKEHTKIDIRKSALEKAER
jgi:peptidyl-prolyl cis-trans isomerase D